MLTVGENTNLFKFIRYIEPAVKAGNRTYWVWKKGPVPDRLGAWAENAPVPNIKNVKQLFCAAGRAALADHLPDPGGDPAFFGSHVVAHPGDAL
jgi:hypothetical protein